MKKEERRKRKEYYCQLARCFLLVSNETSVQMLFEQFGLDDYIIDLLIAEFCRFRFILADLS